MASFARTKEPPGGTGNAASEVSLLILQVMAHIHRRSAGDTLAIMSQAGLTMAQLVTLHVLEHRGALSVTRVARLLRLSPAATSHLIDRLFVAHLVARTEDPVDRRHKRVAITEQGRTLVQRVQEERTAEMTRVIGRLSAELQRQFVKVLARVVTELAALPEPQDVPDECP